MLSKLTVNQQRTTMFRAILLFELFKNKRSVRVGRANFSCLLLFQQGFQPPMLIFVQSKDRAKELFHELIYDGINVDVIHSDRTQAQVSS